ncbi:hypothetical protein [Blastococcus sp. SYSU D00695]
MAARARTAVPAVLLALVAALGLALATACTRTAGDGEPAPDGRLGSVAGSVDLDAAVGADARMAALAARPGGGAVALLATGDGGALVEIVIRDDAPRIGTVTPLEAPGPGAELVVTPDGTPRVVGVDRATGTLELTAGTAAVALGRAPDTVAAALSPDGSTLVVAAADRRLLAVDPVTGAVRATGEVPAVEGDDPGTVTRIAVGADGAVAALLATDGGQGTALARVDADLRPEGPPVRFLPKEATRPAEVQLTADGTAVVTLATADSARLLTVRGRDVDREVDLGRAADSGLDLAVDPAGHSALVPLAALQEEARVASVDLRTGELGGGTALCEGFGSLGATALSADGDTLVVTGVCRADGANRAWVLR